jgi:hypothetical protein
MNLMEKYLRKLEGNRYTLTPGEENALVSKLHKDKARPLREIFEENFNRLAEKLESYSLTADDIKTQSPILYQRIQDAIDEMDAAWLKKDLTAFSEAIRIIEQLYLKAMREIPER